MVKAKVLNSNSSESLDLLLIRWLKEVQRHNEVYIISVSQSESSSSIGGARSYTLTIFYKDLV